MKVCVSLATPQQLNVMAAQVEGGVYQSPSVRDSFWIWNTEPPKYSAKCPDYLNDSDFILSLIKGQGMKIGPYGNGQWYASNTVRGAVGATLEEAVLRCHIRHAVCHVNDDVEIPKEFA
jgi:hypothetical protein